MNGRKLRAKARLLIILIVLLGGCLGVYIFSPNVQDLTKPAFKLAKQSLKVALPLQNSSIIKGNSAILIDASTGNVVVEQDADIAFPIASMSKIMTEYLVQEQIEDGTIHWDDQVQMTESANNIDSRASKIYVKPRDFLTIRDLYSAMVISSANNATKVLAEHIAGTEEEFARLMNDKAREMGLSDKTHFVNSTGLPNADHTENQMTAKDVAQLAYQLLLDFPEVVETTKLTKYRLAFDGTVLRNSNSMLFPENQDLYFEQVDGLKTGFTEAAGYCFTGTAKLGDKRLISVVMGAKSDEARFLETHKLFSFGFKNF
ncbi:D-alanyl-D-alanine carboxypeptidase family protein [Sporosarcina limicola]|uniref:D-alanyl-D-alanine carboxypeptidase n=1 Tax=Sporosarcina limicola TaxID=34101 RepID=A0A927R7G3_9BACL|nr:D-alanyl-D-alanine carboxypeptidase family protein [Sporosarcina limicola]MBE1555959.1 D-alanyl-D-alanine carboxypeptidase [Sporosarcina limicola]